MATMAGAAREQPRLAQTIQDRLETHRAQPMVDQSLAEVAQAAGMKELIAQLATASAKVR